MQVKDLIVTGDAKIIGNLYTSNGLASGGGSGGSGDDSGLTYTLSKSGSTITLTGSDGSTSSVTDSNTDTNTTYSAATTSAAGLMSASDKSKLDGITASADTVSFSRSLTSGTKIGTITINGTGTDLYCQTNTDTNTTYSAGTGISLSGTTFSNSGVRSVGTGSTNGTISVNTNGTSANVAVKGLGSAAYTASTAYAAASHTHGDSSVLGYTPSYIKMVKGSSETNYSSSNTTFAPFNSSVTASAYVSKGNLSIGTSAVTTTEREVETWVINIGANIHTVRVSGGVRYMNNDSSGCNLHTYLIHNFGGDGESYEVVDVTSNYINGNGYVTQKINTIVNVSEGDYLYVYAYKASASKNIDVLSDEYPYAATQLCVEAIG